MPSDVECQRTFDIAFSNIVDDELNDADSKLIPYFTSLDRSCLDLARSARSVFKPMALRALLVHVRIFQLKVLFPYFTCNFGRVGPSFDHDGTAI